VMRLCGFTPSLCQSAQFLSSYTNLIKYYVGPFCASERTSMTTPGLADVSKLLCKPDGQAHDDCAILS
jgi:hypothetical protein